MKSSSSSKNKKSVIPEGLLPAYLASAFGELYEEDGLMVMARGLGWLSLLAAFCRFYGDVNDGYLSILKEENPKEGQRTKPPLVIVLGLRDNESASVLSLLETWGTPRDFLPTILTNEIGGSEDRAVLYSRGGVICITSRILIVDLLTNVVSPKDIDGIFIAHADQVSNDSTSAFIIRIYTSLRKRDHSFIKAITDRPENLSSGFAKVRYFRIEPKGCGFVNTDSQPSNSLIGLKNTQSAAGSQYIFVSSLP
jgi:DNA excision repair protein ERCC-4